MQIQHQQNGDQGEFFLLDAKGQKWAILSYFFVDNQRINANHTFVSEKLRGQGIADKLYQSLVKFVKKNQLTLIPTCSYIAKKWERENHKK